MTTKFLSRTILMVLAAGGVGGLGGCSMFGGSSTADATETSTEYTNETTAAATTEPIAEMPKAQGPDGAEYPILSTDARSDGMVIDDLRFGSGATVNDASTVAVIYHGTFEDGTVFDTVRGQDPAVVQVSKMIRGLQLGLTGMKVGGVRRFTIPPTLGFGENGTPDGHIPPNTTLTFAVEVIGVQD